MVIALVVGAPSLRVRGLNLAVITLGIAMVADVMFFADISVTGGPDGIPIPPAKFLGVNLNALTHARSFSVAVLVVALLLGLGSPCCGRRHWRPGCSPSALTNVEQRQPGSQRPVQS